MRICEKQTTSRFAMTGLTLVVALAACGGSRQSAPGPAASAVVDTNAIGPAAATPGAAAVTPPASPRQPTQDVLHGVKIVDDYRWLEPDADPTVKSWSDAQNVYARSVLDQLPSLSAIRARVTELDSGTSPDYFALEQRKGMLFALKDEPPKQQPFLVVTPKGGAERVVLDPGVVDAKGQTTIDFYAPSLDGKLVAVSLSRNGSEDGTVHVYDVASGKEQGDVIPGVNYGTAGGSVAWNASGSGFFYTRYPRGNEQKPEDMHFFQQVWFHTLGSKTESDVYVVGKDFPRIAEIELVTSDDGKWVLAEISNGDGGEMAHYLGSARAKPGQGKWTQVTRFDERVVSAQFGPAGDPDLYLFSHGAESRGQILTVPLASPVLARAKVLVPEGKEALANFVATRTRLYISRMIGGPSQLHVHDLKAPMAPGNDQLVATLPVSSIGQLVRGEGDELLFRNESFINAPAWYRVAGSAAAPERTAMAREPVADYSDTEVVRVMARSKDGTQVPLSIIRKKGLVLNKQVPTILTGYGGYGVSRPPRFSDLRRLWIEQGGVYASANLRGGSEFGDAWHLAGNLTRKQNVFDDFAACAQLLMEQGYTSPAKLAIMGGSNGGLLMGAAFTQHPEMFRAVVSFVGIYDMLRVELSPNGAFNVTEFGTVKDPAQFTALHAYSPYHHVSDGTQYPSVLFLTGANDPRVEPSQSRKMTARLQGSGTQRPVLLRTSASSGHGIGTALAEQIEEDVDVYAFLFRELGVNYQPVGPSAQR